MKAVTLWQPHASLMRLGVKTIETRGWWTTYRGELAIHSAKALTNEMHESWAVPAIRLAFREAGIDDFWSLPQGQILCVVNLFACTNTENFDPALKEREFYFGDFSPGRFGWATTELKVLKEPVKCRGFQQIWTVPPDVEAKVRAQI